MDHASRRVRRRRRYGTATETRTDTAAAVAADTGGRRYTGEEVQSRLGVTALRQWRQIGEAADDAGGGGGGRGGRGGGGDCRRERGERGRTGDGGRHYGGVVVQRGGRVALRLRLRVRDLPLEVRQRVTEDVRHDRLHRQPVQPGRYRPLTVGRVRAPTETGRVGRTHFIDRSVVVMVTVLLGAVLGARSGAGAGGGGLQVQGEGSRC